MRMVKEALLENKEGAEEGADETSTCRQEALKEVHRARRPACKWDGYLERLKDRHRIALHLGPNAGGEHSADL